MRLGLFEIFTHERMIRFEKKGKLSRQYVGPYDILKRVGSVAYELKFPNELAIIHPVFHVSMHKNCIGDTISILPLERLGGKRGPLL